MLTLTSDARRRANRLGLTAVLGSGLVFLAFAPFATTPLPSLPAFVAAQQTALVIFDLLTAVLLFGQAIVLRSRALFVLACGYVFNAFMAAAHALVFPGVFSPSGLLGAGPQSAAWMTMFRHGGFPLAVIGYGLLAGASEPATSDVTTRHGRDGLAIGAGVCVAFLVACALTCIATSRVDVLPALISDGGGFTPAMTASILVCGLLCVVAMALLWHRRRLMVLDVWLRAVMSIWLLDLALSGLFSGARYDLGWYGGRICALLAGGLLLACLLVESLRNHLALVATSRETRATNAELERRIAARTSELVLALDASHAANQAKSAFWRR